MYGRFVLNVELLFKAKIVHLILLRRSEEALELLSQQYNTVVPKLRVGLPSGHRKSLGCYVVKKKTIYVLNHEGLHNPYLIIHEFYHHLRMHDNKHKGTEKHARRFAEEYFNAYKFFSAQII